MTGIISLFPGLNIVTVPSLWHQSSKKVMTGFFGLSIATVAWLMGANTGIKNILSTQNESETVIISSSNQKQINTNTVTSQPLIDSIPSKPITNFIESEMQSLPKKALYKMSFDKVPVNRIDTLQGRIVQVIKTNNDHVEGRIEKISASSVLLGNGVETEIPLANIKQLSLMVKKVSK
ncbi:MAG: hypothetical protein V3U71_06090 [Cocleimonas sp.]